MKPLFLIPILIFVTTKLLGQVGYPADLYINLKNEKQIPQKYRQDSPRLLIPNKKPAVLSLRK